MGMVEAAELAKALIAGASASDRLYPLQSHDPYGFYAGGLPGGEQAIVFWESPGKVAALRFSATGEYLGVEVWEYPPLPRMEKGEDRTRLIHEHFRGAFGLTPGVVRVRRFFADRWQVGIRPVEDFHEEFAADPAAFCSGDAAGIADELDCLRSWVEARQFVFDCGNNYWVDDCGKVFSS
jgi:hypothetical protein